MKADLTLPGLEILPDGSYASVQFGVGLAAAIIIDVFVVRTALVPALMHLFGRANWWLPGWLDRRLPHLAVDVQQSVGRIIACGAVGINSEDSLPGQPGALRDTTEQSARIAAAQSAAEQSGASG